MKKIFGVVFAVVLLMGLVSFGSDDVAEYAAKLAISGSRIDAQNPPAFLQTATGSRRQYGNG
jgi:hypothetical protein